ncbi:MAG: alpha/beta hydrolase [Candidatus Melainabacteria bacterium]|nr:alpha/beta hydrolase [Candidatus Melainabacteria bacterium]
MRLVLLLVLFFLCAEARAQNVYFATDRTFTTSKDGCIKFHKQNTTDLSQLQYGILNSKEVSKQTKCTHKMIDGWHEFKEQFRSEISKYPEEHFILYVHGCCVDFKESSKQAMLLAETAGKPVLVYDWGTPKGNYFGSMLACPRAQERFNSFIFDIFQEYPKARISVVGLSMGNVLVYNFCLQNKVSDLPRHFNEIEMARADIDTIVFRTNMHRVVPHCDKLDLYVAKNDFLINISGFMRGLIYPYPPVFMLGYTPGNTNFGNAIQIFDVSRLRMGHLLPGEAISDVLKGPEAYKLSDKYNFSETRNGVQVITIQKKKK